jgi:hypothetical protein
VGGADVLAVRKRRQPLDVHAEQPRERLGLGLAQLREPRGDMLHRAVSLAELGAPAGLQRAHARGVPVRGQRLGERRDALPLVGAGGLDRGPVPGLEVVHVLVANRRTACGPATSARNCRAEVARSS